MKVQVFSVLMAIVVSTWQTITVQASACDVSSLSPDLYFIFEESSVSSATNTGSAGSAGNGVLYPATGVGAWTASFLQQASTCSNGYLFGKESSISRVVVSENSVNGAAVAAGGDISISVTFKWDASSSGTQAIVAWGDTSGSVPAYNDKLALVLDNQGLTMRVSGVGGTQRKVADYSDVNDGAFHNVVLVLTYGVSHIGLYAYD